MSRDSVLKEVAADKIRTHVEHIVQQIPHRAAGSPNGRRMAEYSRDAMIKTGVQHTIIHELPAIVSFPRTQNSE